MEIGSQPGDDVVDDSIVPSLRDATNVLIVSRSEELSDRRIVRELITDTRIGRKNVLHVTLDESIHDIMTEWYRSSDAFPDRLAAISAADFTRSTDSQPSEGLRRYPRIISVDERPDLETLGSETVALLDEWETVNGPIEVDINSVCTLLDRYDHERVFRFLHAFTNCIERAEATAYYCLDATTCSESTVKTVDSLFDTVVTATATSEIRVTS